jgi:anti-sigma-K factor RskA
MSDALVPRDERDALAAEYVLGLLEGDDLTAAHARLDRDAEFAASVDAWHRRLAPLFDGVRDVEPPADLWQRIERRLDAQTPGSESGEVPPNNVVPIAGRERFWRRTALGMTALAAGLALVLGLRIAEPDRPAPPPVRVQPEPALIASLASDDNSAALAVAVEAGRGTILVTPARLAPVPGRDRQLWLIPAGATTPVSLGLIRSAAPQRIRIPAALAAAFGPKATIALSVEPTGGSPTDLPTGPVIASGTLDRI